jgi:glutaredoxin
MVLTIYSKPGCHLCDEMKAVVHRCRQRDGSIVLEEIDISSDPELLTRYGIEIPVLMIEGRKVAKYRISEEDLERILAGRRF